MFDVNSSDFCQDSVVLKLNIHVSVGCSINRPIEIWMPLLSAAAAGGAESDPMDGACVRLAKCHYSFQIHYRWNYSYWARCKTH